MTFRVALLVSLATLGFSQTRLAARSDALLKPAASAVKKISFQKNIQPLLAEYCYSCHGNGKKKGDVVLDAYPSEAALVADQKTWEKVMHNLTTHTMPPEKKKQPSPEERERIVAWIQAEVFQCDCDHPDPGRVTLRRLNRAEYNNTIRDLVGVNFQPADDFPQDDVGYGFDNIGDVLSLPPLLMEKYLAAAEKIMSQAIVTDLKPGPRTNQFAAAALKGTSPFETTGEGMRRLGREGDIQFSLEIPFDGEYLFRARAFGDQAGTEPPRLALSVEGREVARFDVPVESDSPQVYETRLKLTAGKKKFAAAYLNNFRDLKNPNPKRRDRNLIIDWLELVQPEDKRPRQLPETHRRLFTRPVTPENKADVAREIIGGFARRAYRRPVTAEEVNRLAQFVALAEKEGEGFEKGIKLALEAVLVSPHFLFRGEWQPEPDNPKSIHPISDHALASRLSYFLWSSLPDEALFAEAARGTLRKNLEPQVRRMMQDPKARALVENFAGQWLQIRNLSQVAPAKETFPDFDEPLRVAMQKETELFFAAILKEDRSVLEFLDANYTFLNGRLARHYGIGGVEGEAFQRVALKGGRRGGVLTHASVLTITSNPTRTSPVKRGKWILENILGTPPPPPPPDVPELKEGKELTGTLRQRMEQHRANVLCASCHARMDPIGFGFENFDGTGAWREKDGASAIDPAGQLVSGESFKGPADLKAILIKRKREEFLRCLSEKMLTYALGRGLEYYDKCAVDEMTKELGRNKYRFSALVLGVVKSAPFQKRRGEAASSAGAE